MPLLLSLPSGHSVTVPYLQASLESPGQLWTALTLDFNRGLLVSLSLLPMDLSAALEDRARPAGRPDRPCSAAAPTSLRPSLPLCLERGFLPWTQRWPLRTPTLLHSLLCARREGEEGQRSQCHSFSSWGREAHPRDLTLPRSEESGKVGIFSQTRGFPHYSSFLFVRKKG